MTPHLIEPKPVTEPFVNFEVTKGGETWESSQIDAFQLRPHPDYSDGVEMRVFGEGAVVEFRFSKKELIEALQMVEGLRLRSMTHKQRGATG